MKKSSRLFIVPILFFLLFQPIQVIAQTAPETADVIINPGDCKRDNNREGLRIDVSPNGTCLVYNKEFVENFKPMESIVRFGGKLKKPSLKLNACSMTKVEGTGTQKDPYTVLSVYKLISPDSNREYTLIQTLTYQVPKSYFFIDYQIIGDQTITTEDVHIFSFEDTAPGGTDNMSRGYTDGTLINLTARAQFYKPNTATYVYGLRKENDNTADASASAVNKPTCFGLSANTKNEWPAVCPEKPQEELDARKPNACVIYKSETVFTNIYYGPAGGNNSPLNSIASVNEYTKSLNGNVSTICHDNAILTHWNIGSLNPYESKNKRLMIGYGETFEEFKNVVVKDQKASLSNSSPVELSFSKSAFEIPEGDTRGSAKGISLFVKGGKLNGNQPAKIEKINTNTLTSNRLISGVNIPADDYTNGKEIEIDNLSITGNLRHQTKELGSIDLGVSTECGFLIKKGKQAHTIIKVQDDDDILVSVIGVDPNFRIQFDKKVVFNQPIRVYLEFSGDLEKDDLESIPDWYTKGYIDIPANTSSLALTPLKKKSKKNLLQGTRFLKVKVKSAKGGNP